MTFGERLKTLRIEKGYTQCQLSKRAGITQYQLSVYERNGLQPSLSTLEWLCEALGVSATELLGF